MDKLHLRSLSPDELKAFLTTKNIPTFRASQILSWLHEKHTMNFSEMTNLSKSLADELEKIASVSALQLESAPESKDGESVKYLMKTQDGHLLESVLIVQGGSDVEDDFDEVKSGRKKFKQKMAPSSQPASRKRFTVCVSTQLGCRIRCSFCASGKGKFGRNLSAGEIVEQVSQIAKKIGRSVTNVVFMGMGEPLDNYDATMRALEILTADWGFGLGGRRITLSTSGLTPQIEQFVKDSRGRVRLSISLHSSDQKLRSELVPINRKYGIEELVESLAQIKKTLKREITFEYTLIRGVNDSQKEAHGVAKIANRLSAKVNLIPYNPIHEMTYERPNPAGVEKFRSLLEQAHVRVTVRQTAGRDIDAACGQLRLDRA